MVSSSTKMKIVFICFECENYAIQLFSALLKQKGHKVYLIFDPRLFNTDEVRQPLLSRLFDIRRNNLNKIKEISPDLVGFSVYTQDYQYALSFARMIKKEMPDIPIIFGGIHCILCPDEVIKEDCVDMVCTGEGEGVIIQLGEEEIPKDKYVFPPRPLIQDLDSLPFIDRDIFYEQKPVFKRDISILTGRGCPYSCTFCASDALNRQYRKNSLGKSVRQRSVQNVIEELEIVKKKYNPHSIYFVDDVFTMNIDWLKTFIPEYKLRIKLPFYCTANPGTIKDEELYLLKQAGCQMIGFGMQSCNEEYRNDYLKRRGTNVRIKRVAGICHQIGIHFSFDHIFNLPMEKIENQMDALKFYNETRPDIINTFDMTYLPKIELNKYLDDKTKQSVEQGKIRTAMFNRNSDNFGSIFTLIPLLPKSWIDAITNKKLIRYIKLPFLIRLFLKDIKRLMIGRYSDVFFPIRLLLVNIKDNLLIKMGAQLRG